MHILGKILLSFKSHLRALRYCKGHTNLNTCLIDFSLVVGEIKTTDCLCLSPCLI